MEYFNNAQGVALTLQQALQAGHVTEPQLARLQALGWQHAPVAFADVIANDTQFDAALHAPVPVVAQQPDPNQDNAIDPLVAAVPGLDQLTPAQRNAYLAAVPAQGWLNWQDLNGECFVAGDSGEREEVLNHRRVIFPPGCPHAREASPGQPVVIPQQHAAMFVKVNYHYLRQVCPTVPAPTCAKIAFLRFLAARYGLISPAFRTATFFVRYNEAVQYSLLDILALNMPATNEYQVGLTADVRRSLMGDFSNMACCVAYMFRVRGHHWVADMDENYKGLWAKCLKDTDNPGLDWQYIAHHALHAIMPIVLDDYWKVCKDEGRVAGALVKRFDSAPAGVAAIRAVYVGAADLRMCLPAIENKLKDQFKHLDELVALLRANRWAGSINRRFYNAPEIDFDEQKFGAIASVVLQALNTFASNSQLTKSRALQRVANNAPITGGIVSRGIATAATDPSLVKAMLLDVPVGVAPQTNQ